MSKETVRVPYHLIREDIFDELKFDASDKIKSRLNELAAIAVLSFESIKTGLLAVDTSPFKTVFVVDKDSRQVKFALTKNQEYLQRARSKKDPEPPRLPPMDPDLTNCCAICESMGSGSCLPLENGDCICFWEGSPPINGDPSQPLEVLWP